MRSTTTLWRTAWSGIDLNQCRSLSCAQTQVDDNWHLHGYAMRLSNEKLLPKAVPMIRAWVRLAVCLLLAAGIVSHPIHDSKPSVVGGAPASQVINAAVQPAGGAHHRSSATSHCQSPASCAFLPVSFSALIREPESGDWTPGPSRDERSTFVHRQFRPPRLPAHA